MLSAAGLTRVETRGQAQLHLMRYVYDCMVQHTWEYMCLNIMHALGPTEFPHGPSVAAAGDYALGSSVMNVTFEPVGPWLSLSLRAVFKPQGKMRMAQSSLRARGSLTRAKKNLYRAEISRRYSRGMRKFPQRKFERIQGDSYGRGIDH